MGGVSARHKLLVLWLKDVLYNMEIVCNNCKWELILELFLKQSLKWDETFKK